MHLFRGNLLYRQSHFLTDCQNWPNRGVMADKCMIHNFGQALPSLSSFGHTLSSFGNSLSSF